jgi:peptidyl-prolyl cis-trans isomerase A (cyclophilin A)
MRSAAARLIAIAASAVLAASCGPRNPRVELVTQFGTIRVEVDSARAPRTAANFQRYVDENRFRDASFYRVRREEAELMQQTTAIVQGGLYLVDDTTRLLPAIPLESTRQTGLRHVAGTVSMARFDVNSARAEFFIVIGDQPHLDWRDAQRPGYAAFGRVVEGMELVRSIRDLPVDGERLRRPIPFSARRVE